jgi:hypothetical protein
MLTGCGGEEPAAYAPKTGGGTTTMATLTGEQLCDLVDDELVERQFGQGVEDAQGGREKNTERETVTCTYLTQSQMDADIDEMADALAVSTMVRASGESDPQDALEAYFRDDSGETAAYTPVDGLGEAAGYADTSLHVRLGGNHFVAIVEADGKLLEVAVETEPDGTRDQLTPIGEMLVAGVEATLG